MPDNVTQVRVAGPVGSKRNLAILGDGFADADQTAYNTWVDTTLLAGVFASAWKAISPSWTAAVPPTHKVNSRPPTAAADAGPIASRGSSP